MKVLVKSVNFLTKEKQEQELDLLCEFSEADTQILKLSKELRNNHPNCGFVFLREDATLNGGKTTIKETYLPINLEAENLKVTKGEINSKDFIKKWFNIDGNFDENPFLGLLLRKD